MLTLPDIRGCEDDAAVSFLLLGPRRNSSGITTVMDHGNGKFIQSYELPGDVGRNHQEGSGVIEITSHPCRQIDRADLRHRAERIDRQGESRIFLRRTWVLFSLAVLGLGVWDSAVVQFHPLRGPIVIVGGVISTLLLGLMILHDRQDRRFRTRSAAVHKDAESGEMQRIRITGIVSVLKVTGRHEPGPAYLLRTEADAAYLAGDYLSDPIDEYHYQQLAAGLDHDFTFAGEVLIELWPISEEIRTLELTGEQAPGPVKTIDINELPVEQETRLKIIPADALPPAAL